MTNNIFHPSQWTTSDSFAAVGLAFSLLTLLGIVFAAWQALYAKKALKAQALMKLIDEWRSPEMYQAVMYINKLRRQWKQQGGRSDELAATWVSQHMPIPETADKENKAALDQENLWRRTAAQFFTKMGVLMNQGYLTPDEYFRVVPELGRYLEPVINFVHRVFVKKCLYIVYTFRHYARDETDAKELSE